ncbi:MAG: Fur family transcriptional regulator [Pseudomonadota bacterium]
MKRAKHKERVLEILRERQGPMTAYEILGELRAVNPKAAPPTVYRALKSLTDSGCVHRIESLNAFLLCQGAGHEGPPVMSICSDCGRVDESAPEGLLQELSGLAAKTGFTPKRHVVEVHGLCSDCDERSSPA